MLHINPGCFGDHGLCVGDRKETGNRRLIKAAGLFGTDTDRQIVGPF
jgi:hypothetical protein